MTDRPRPASAQEIGNGEDVPVDVHAPEVPHAIRERVLALMNPGDQLWRCPRRTAPRGLLGLVGIGPRDAIIEWWLVDARGELVEAFWEVE